MYPRRHSLVIGMFTAIIGTASHAATNDVQALLVEQGKN